MAAGYKRPSRLIAERAVAEFVRLSKAIDSRADLPSSLKHAAANLELALESLVHFVEGQLSAEEEDPSISDDLLWGMVCQTSEQTVKAIRALAKELKVKV